MPFSSISSLPRSLSQSSALKTPDAAGREKRKKESSVPREEEETEVESINLAPISLGHARLYAELTQENSDRRKAEEALRASEERWRKLFENSSVGIALVTPAGR